MGIHSLLQAIFLTQGSTPGLLHCRKILYCLKVSIYFTLAASAVKSLQSYPTLCDPIDSSPPGSLVPGILQARTLEWVAIYTWAHLSLDELHFKCSVVTCDWLLATMLNNVALEINNNWLVVLGRISQTEWKSEIILKEVRTRLDNFYEEHFLMWENYNYLLSNESTEKLLSTCSLLLHAIKWPSFKGFTSVIGNFGRYLIWGSKFG